MPNGFEQVKKNRPRKNKSRDFLKQSNFNSQEYFNRKLQKAQQEFEASQLWFETLQNITESLQSISSDSVNEILCYGLGNFTEKKSSLYQFIALVNIQKQYNCFVRIYDPAFTPLENKILISLGFKILSENEEGKRKVSNDQVTLVYLPHCPKQLTNNFLWANWGPSLTKCILINNSFAKILEDNTEKVLAESANYIVKIFPKTKEIPLDCNTDVFNDISVHWFEAECDFFIQTLDKEPVYELKASGSGSRSPLVKYILHQCRKYQTTGQQFCKAREEMQFLAETYSCYLKSQRMFEEIHLKYRGKGERSIEETAKIVGFKLPHDNGKQ